jgi:hypothetical protein
VLLGQIIKTTEVFANKFVDLGLARCVEVLEFVDGLKLYYAKVMGGAHYGVCA